MAKRPWSDTPIRECKSPSPPPPPPSSLEEVAFANLLDDAAGTSTPLDRQQVAPETPGRSSSANQSTFDDWLHVLARNLTLALLLIICFSLAVGVVPSVAAADPQFRPYVVATFIWTLIVCLLGIVLCTIAGYLGRAVCLLREIRELLTKRRGG